MTPMISVIKPGSGGVPIGMSIPNPLYQYNFQSLATISTYFPTSVSIPHPVSVLASR